MGIFKRASGLAAELAAQNEVASSPRFSPLQPPANNRALFIAAMADPAKRQIAFDVVERNCRAAFAEGAEGVKLFLQLLKDIQSSKIDAAVDEFEKRFVPMLDQNFLKTKFEQVER